MFETLMSSIKTHVVSSEFRSTTAANVRRMYEAMQAAQEQARTNGGDLAIDGDAAAPGAPSAEPSRPPQAPAASANENRKAVADVFASMMSRQHQAGAVLGNGGAGLPPPAPAANVGRNDPCPCGSGKKYKKCCGRGL